MATADTTSGGPGALCAQQQGVNKSFRNPPGSSVLSDGEVAFLAQTIRLTPLGRGLLLRCMDAMARKRFPYSAAQIMDMPASELMAAIDTFVATAKTNGEG